MQTYNKIKTICIINSKQAKFSFFSSDIKWSCIRVNKMIIMLIVTLINYGFELYVLAKAVQTLGSVKRGGVSPKHKIW